MSTTHNAVIAVMVTDRLTATRCTQHQVTDRGQSNTTSRNQVARFLHRRTAQPVPSRRLRYPQCRGKQLCLGVAPQFAAGSVVRAGPSLDPTLFPPEPLQDQINDQFTYPPQTTMGLPGKVMTDEQ